MVPPRNTTRRRPTRGIVSRSTVKSPTTGWTSMPAYSFSIAAAASCSVRLLTSKGTNRRSDPASRIASRSTRVFSDVPEPSSTRVSAPEARTISLARASRIARSRRVG